MALQSTFEIYIGGERIGAIKEFSLIEKVGHHATFNMTARMDVLERISENTSLMADSKNFLGQNFAIQVSAIGNLEGYQQLEFKGVVTNIENSKGFFATEGDTIMIQGMSSSIITDDGPHMASYAEQMLSDIAEQAIGSYDHSKLNVVIAPENNDTLLYAVQHMESSFEFLQRLAASRGEFLLYNKDTLYFGKPDLGDDVTLTYGTDLHKFSLGISPKTNKFKYFTHNYFTNEAVETKTDDVASDSQGYTSFATGVANDLYYKETNIHHNVYDDTQLQQRLDQQVALQRKMIEQQQVSVSGMSDNPGVGLGKIISINDESGSYGRYRVTDITHEVNETGKYQNKFTAVSADIDVYPLTDIHSFPKCGTQIAKIIENKDPEGMGRIKVQFPWQVPMGQMTPWIRMAIPHGGQDQGFHFIPEKGDEVLISFEQDNAEKPYMSGALYHGTAKPDSWATENNDIKAIRTRSGHTIELNDTNGEEKISIYDKDASTIIFDTQAKSLTIQATETIDIVAKNINITAEENITIGAQQNVEIAAQADLNALAEGNVALQSTGDTTMRSNASLSIEATTDATVKGQNAIIEGQVGAEVNGAQTKVTGSAMTEVTGSILKLN